MIVKAFIFFLALFSYTKFSICSELVKPSISLHKIVRDRINGVVPVLVEDNDEESEDTCDSKNKMVVYYSFDMGKSGVKRITDQSGCDNNGIINQLSIVVKEPKSNCGQVLLLLGYDLKITASGFQNPPRVGITVSIWLRLTEGEKIREVFSVNGPHFGKLSLEINNPYIIWSLIDCNGKILFRTQAIGQIAQEFNKKQFGWFHLATTYDTTSGVAQIFVNGNILNRTISNSLEPFKYWGNNIRVGGNENGKPLNAFVDEFKIFNSALKASDINFLSSECQFNANPIVYKRDKMISKPEIIDNIISESSSFSPKESIESEENNDDEND